ncbi:MAG TPA: glycosyltransferase family 39 protein, partial [Magnetospirillaceae bacterium]|nr:glycosyltransferase family 39 protein [Magnetospirillaceae bacterium]
MAKLSGERRFDWVPAAMAGGALALGLIFRFWGAGSQPLWLDEAYSAFAADHGFAFLWQVVPHYETHPPFYYSLLRCWRLIVGDGLLAGRLLGLLCGLATLVVGGIIAHRLARLTRMHDRERRGLIAVTIVLLSLHPLIIEMSRQLRPYPVMILAYAAVVPALLRLVEDSIRRRMPDRGALLAVFAVQALMLWLHSLGPLYALAIALALGVAVFSPGLTRADWRWLIGGETIVGLVYLPAFLILREQAPGWVASSWLTFTTTSLPARVGQIYLDWNFWARLVGLGAAMIGTLLLLGRIGGRRVTVILIVLAGVPVALSLLLSAAVAPVFLDRTLSPVAVPALLLVGTGLVWSGRRAWIGWLALLVIAGSMVGIDRLLLAKGPLQDWYGTIAWLDPRLGPGDRVWSYP